MLKFVQMVCRSFAGFVARWTFNLFGHYCNLIPLFPFFLISLIHSLCEQVSFSPSTPGMLNWKSRILSRAYFRVLPTGHDSVLSSCIYAVLASAGWCG